MFAFDNQSNERFIQAHYEQNHDKLERVRALMCHIMNVHHIWISRVLDRPVESEDWDDLPFHAWSDLNEDNHRLTLFALEQLDVQARVSYVTSEGESMNKSVGEILSHILWHSNYHRAQINLLLRQADLEPLECNLISHPIVY